jgi:putative ABC transport system permease protein
MKWTDTLAYCGTAFGAQRTRTVVSVLGIVIGVASVVILSSIGTGTRDYVLDQFTQFGTNILQISPGKTETVGLPGVLGGTTHKLSLEDAEALRQVPGIEHVVPVVMGQARVESGARGRSVFVYGVNAEVPEVWKFEIGQGSFLSDPDPRNTQPVAVLGPTLKRELFGESNALGRFVRIAGTRLRVIGVMAPKGRMLGFDVDDAAYVPAAMAMRMFNLDELLEVDLTFQQGRAAEPIVEGVRQVLMDRHRGREDFTILTQKDMLDTFDRILVAVTWVVIAIASISLVVGGIGILTVLWIAVGERVPEIGLLRAIGATEQQVARLFLFESALIGVVGGAAGSVIGVGLTLVLRKAVPGLPVQPSLSHTALALGVSLAIGVLAGVLPARRAARLDPVIALRME